MESYALNSQVNGYNGDNNYVVLQESDLSTFDSMFFNTTPQQVSEDHFLTPSPMQSQHLFTPNSSTTPENQQIFNQYMFAFLHQLQSQQNNTCTNFNQIPMFETRSQHDLFDHTTSFNLNGNTMLRLDSEEIFLNEEDVTVNQNIQQNFNENQSSKPNMPLHNNPHTSFMSFNHHFNNESNAIGTPSDLKEEEFFSGFIPEMYHADVDAMPKNDACPSPLSSSSASNSASNSINNSSTNNVNNTNNNNSGPNVELPGLTSNFSPKEATLSSWFNSISKLPESSIVLKCDPYGFTENNGTCRPRGSQYSVFVNDNIRIDFSFKIPSNLDLYFEQDGVNRSIFDLFIEECKFELCSYMDDDDTNSEVIIESTDSISNIKKTDDIIQISLNTVIKRDTNNKRASRSKAKPAEEKKGRKKKKNESCASKKVCFLRIVTPESGFVLARSDNLWVRSKTRQEMERKKDRAMAQKRKKEESKPTEDSQEEKESPKKKKKSSSKPKSKKSKSKSQTVNSFSYEQSPMKGSTNSASYGVVFNLDSM